MATRKHVLGRAAAAALSTAFVPVTAVAQPPSYARPAAPSSSDVINGSIASIDGKYAITVHDDRGFIDDVHLHQGTIINPTGLTLAPGMRVTIFGYNAGSWFEANEIDTPYHYVPRPVPVYIGPGWWYPGFPYGYGPSYTLVVRGGGVVRRPFHPEPVHIEPPHIPAVVARPYHGRR